MGDLQFRGSGDDPALPTCGHRPERVKRRALAGSGCALEQAGSELRRVDELVRQFGATGARNGVVEYLRPGMPDENGGNGAARLEGGPDEP
jgi:hypothetical protein